MQQRWIGYSAVLTGKSHNALNKDANTHAGCKSVEEAAEDQLKCRRVFIE